jgi:hypothetical protein
MSCMPGMVSGAATIGVATLRPRRPATSRVMTAMTSTARLGQMQDEHCQDRHDDTGDQPACECPGDDIPSGAGRRAAPSVTRVSHPFTAPIISWRLKRAICSWQRWHVHRLRPVIRWPPGLLLNQLSAPRGCLLSRRFIFDRHGLDRWWRPDRALIVTPYEGHTTTQSVS